MKLNLTTLLGKALLFFTLLQSQIIQGQISTPLTNVNVSASADTVCSGSTVTLTTATSQAGKFYYFRNNTTGEYLTPPIAGTGSSLSYTTSALSTSSTFDVLAEHVIEGLNFDGTNDYISTGLSLSGSDGTWEAWVKKDNWADHHDDILMGNGIPFNSSGSFYISLHPSAGFHFRYGGTVQTGNIFVGSMVTQSFSSNSWHHLAASWQHNSGVLTLKLYADGVLLSTVTEFLQLGSISNIKIGGDGTGSSNYFGAGSMRDVRFYNSALTDGAIAADYYKKLNGSETDLAAFYKLNETSGTTATDATANALHGTLTNMNTPTCWSNNALLTAPVPTSLVMSPIINVVVGYIVNTNITAIGQYTWPINNQTYTASGNYNYAVSCTTYYLNLTLDCTPVNNTITANGYYIWPNNNQIYTSSGTYTVNNGCKNDTLNLTIVPTPGKLIVYNTNDNGVGSLRDAIAQANVNTDTDTIIFTGINYPATITLTTGQLDITQSLVIKGPGRDNLTINGNNSSRIFKIYAYTKVNLRSLSIINGYNSLEQEGGGITNCGNLTLDSIGIFNCKTIRPTGGSAIFVRAAGGLCALVMNNCMVKGNSSIIIPGNDNVGDAVINLGQYNFVVISRSTFESNTSSYGVIFNQTSISANKLDLIVDRCFFKDNKGGYQAYHPAGIVYTGGNGGYNYPRTAFYSCSFIDNNQSYINNAFESYSSELLYFKNCLFRASDIGMSSYQCLLSGGYNCFDSHGDNATPGMTEVDIADFLTTGDMNFDTQLQYWWEPGQDQEVNNGDVTINAFMKNSTYYTFPEPSLLTPEKTDPDYYGNPLVCRADRGPVEYQVSPPLPGITNVTQNNVSCSGLTNGSASLTASGGTGTLTYVWAPSGGTSATANNLAPGNYICTVADSNLCKTTQSITIIQPAVITADIGSTPTGCGNNTGTASVTNIAGGTGSYSYLWSPSGGTAATASGLGVDFYNCTITDANSCSITKNISISTASGPTLSLNNQTNVSCKSGSDGTVTVNPASGGTGSYSYDWSPGNPAGDGTTTASGLSAGSHVCLVTDQGNGCATTLTITITEPDSITATIASQSNITCNGLTNGTVTINATGGTGTLTYAWAPGGSTSSTANNLAAGNYTCTITDSNTCHGFKSVTITEPALNKVTKNITLCSGGSITVGTQTYTTSGNYTDVLTAANSCDSTVITNLTINNPVDVTTNVTANIISANAAGLGYNWIDCDNNNSLIAGAINQSFTASQDGNYAVIVYDGLCSDTSACVNITTTVINNGFEINTVSIYPNPNKGSFTIELNNYNTVSQANIEVIDAFGRVVLKQKISAKKTSLNLEDVSAGMYTVKLITAEGQSIQRLVVHY